MSTSLTIKDHTFEWGSRTYIMGILNITPDSFSGDGLYVGGSPVERALTQARRFIEAGVSILDVGGESTRPGGEPITQEQEMERVLPVVTALAERFDIPISIDTYRAAVAEAALAAGAHMVNDVWALHADPDMAALVAARAVPIILMHNRSKPTNAEVRQRLGGRYVGIEYQDLLEDVKSELLESVALAKKAGVPDEHIILDPGIGFGKTVEQNLELLNRTDEIRALGYPVLLGPSRKSFIGYTLDLPPDQRVEGTAAAVAIGIARGADILRVHDVPHMQRIARMTDAIVRKTAPTKT